MHPIINIAIGAVRSASKIVIRSIDDMEKRHLNRSDSRNFALRVEQLAAEEINAHILKAYPEHNVFISSRGDKQISLRDVADDNLWIIDAIDGFTNYACQIPHFSISVALYSKGKIQHGVVYDPIRQELFTASYGEGAYLNEKRIRVSVHKQLTEAVLGTGFPQGQLQHFKPYMASFNKLFPEVAGVRRNGSSALDLAYVAAGRMDGFWEFNLKPWNMAAGILLVSEAGGIVSDFQNEDHYLENGNIVAGTPRVHKALLHVIQESLQEL